MHVMMLIDLERTGKQEKKAVQSVIIDTLHTNVLDYMLHLEELLCHGNPGHEAPGTLLFMLMLMPEKTGTAAAKSAEHLGLKSTMLLSIC